MRYPLALIAAAGVFSLSGCGDLGQAMTAHTDVVARANGKELRVEEAAEMLALNPQIPAEAQVVRALADLWVDYTLLASAVAEDSTLASLDLNSFTETAREQAVVMKLREQVIRPDTLFSDAQLQERWSTEGPGAEIRARHILLRVPAEATQAQRDSVKQFAETLRQRAAAGENFAALATQHSEDPGSAQRGGDLDYFGRGRMVAPFEEAAFKLQVGQISPVVETPFGYHVIRVEDRRQSQMGGQREQFRQYLVTQAHQLAETAYLDSLSKSANVQVEPGGLAVVREIAGKPESSLKGRAAQRAVATYKGGTFTTGEFLTFIRTQPPQVQNMFTTASDEQLQNAVQQMTRKELLLAEAKTRKIVLSKSEEDSIRSDARQAIRSLVQATGLTGGGTRGGAATDARIKTLIRGYITGQTQLVPLGPFGFLLRDVYPAEINSGTFTKVVQQVEKIRASQPAPAQQAPGAPGAGPAPHPGVPGPPQPGAQQGPPQGGMPAPAAPPR